MIGLFCVDPGSHTGVAWGVVDEKSRTAAEAVANRLHDGHEMIVGEPMVQARLLWNRWERFKNTCHAYCLLDLDKIDLVMEDFILHGGQHAGGRDGTMPLNIIWAFEGYRHGRYDTYRRTKHFTPITWQQAGQASTYKTRERLNNANAWIVGKDADHERTAMAHMILRVNRIMSGKR